MNVYAIAEVAFEPSSPLLDYRQLYEQTKKKVGIFIARVEGELGTILRNHQAEVDQLTRENEALRRQLQEQPSNKLSTASSRPKLHSEGKSLLDNCGISGISFVESKTILLDRKRNSFVSEIFRDKQYPSGVKDRQKAKLDVVNLKPGKENNQQQILALEVSQLKQRVNNSKRARKISLIASNDRQNLKEVLKNLRQRASTPVSYDEIVRREADKKPKDIITPTLFSSHNK